jgi:hypothetical protein
MTAPRGRRAAEKPSGWRPCLAHSPDGDQCILSDGHYGAHQRAPCNGTCDTCDCDFCTDEEMDDVTPEAP